ncbi:hypothetical protein HW555_006188 [Spodoptera exigua]|uniref:Uncharacterized protein n=1 Tax=Spodoptera exigua TaxID=7107 RepID=A0A835GGZ2_SPOEX|nr:hypothetical protein HW555_006188 [Spodoptera exigua]
MADFVSTSVKLLSFANNPPKRTILIVIVFELTEPFSPVAPSDVRKNITAKLAINQQKYCYALAVTSSFQLLKDPPSCLVHCDVMIHFDSLTKEFVKACMAVWFVVLFFECAFIELSETKRAYEVFWVEFSEHGCDATAGDRFVAAGTERATFAVVVGLTVRLAFVLEERSSMERLATFLKTKEHSYN